MEIIRILMSRDGLTRTEALKEVFRVKELLFDELALGKYPMDILEEEFGLEPDYIFEVTPLPNEVTHCEVCNTDWFNLYQANENHKRRYGYGLALPDTFKNACKSCMLVNDLIPHLNKEIVEGDRDLIVKLLKQGAWDYKAIAKELFDIIL